MDGIDCLTIAPFDLSTELRVSGRLDSRELLEAVRHAERAILDAGIPLRGQRSTRTRRDPSPRRDIAF